MVRASILRPGRLVQRSGLSFAARSMAERLLEALTRAKRRDRSQESRVRCVRSFVVGALGGGRVEIYGLYSLQIKRALNAWNARTDWASKDLPNCLPTFGTASGL